jgi:hypothetical protein
MTKQSERTEHETPTTAAAADGDVKEARSTTGIVVRAVALGLLTATVGMTTACCQGAAGAGEGEGE